MNILLNVDLASTIAVVVTLVFIADLFIPDPLPYVDEFLLGVATVVAWMWVFLLRIGRTLFSIWDTISNPFLVAFVAVLVVMFVLSKFVKVNVKRAPKGKKGLVIKKTRVKKKKRSRKK